MEWKVDLEDEKEDSEKDDISNDQPKSILIPEANTNVIRDQGENPEDSQKENHEDKFDVSEAKDKSKGQSKYKEKGKGKEKAKNVEVP